MGVYIKGATAEQINEIFDRYIIHNWKIIEIKAPHGRLIDGDRFYEGFEPNSWSEGMAVSTYIKKAPTVIEAEVE